MGRFIFWKGDCYGSFGAAGETGAETRESMFFLRTVRETAGV
jgi:hypothetical protein